MKPRIKNIKFMYSNPQDMLRLEYLKDKNFSKYVKGKIDEDLRQQESGVNPEMAMLRAQIRGLHQEIGELKKRAPVMLIKENAERQGHQTTVNVDSFFEDH